jgi:hypothetical protein
MPSRSPKLVPLFGAGITGLASATYELTEAYNVQSADLEVTQGEIVGTQHALDTALVQVSTKSS